MKTFMMTAIAAAVLSSSVFAQLPDSTPAALKDRPIQIMNAREVHLPDSIANRLKVIYQSQQLIITDLKNKLSKLTLNEQLKETLISKLDQSIANLQKQSTQMAQVADDNQQLNFLTLQLLDSYHMIMGVRIAANSTNELIEKMLPLATDAISGTHSSEQLANMDKMFQAYKNAIKYVQTVYVVNGNKVLNGGNINIQIGKERTIVNVPEFDSKSLNIEHLNITTVEDANVAVSQLTTTRSYINTVQVATTLPYIEDALTMLLITPAVLYQDYTIFANMMQIILNAANGTLTNTDRANLNIALDYLKAALVKTQTYVSLQGPKQLGGGNIQIQIGNLASADTTLNIALPVSNKEDLGLDKLNVNTQTDAYHALDVMLKDLHDFVYPPVSK